MATLPAPPGLLSITIGCPSGPSISCATARATMDELPPGANGTTSRIGLVGNCCPCAIVAVASRINTAKLRMLPLPSPSELVAAQAAIDRNHCPRDVARERRREKAREMRDVLGLSIFADRNFVLGLPFAV